MSALWVVLWSFGSGKGVNSGAAGWPNLVTGLHACVQTTHPFTNKGRVFLAPRAHPRTKLTMNTDWRGQRQRAPGGLQEGQGMATEQVGLRAVESWCGCGLRYRKCRCWSGWGAGLGALRLLEAGGVTVGTRGGVMAWGGRRGCLVWLWAEVQKMQVLEWLGGRAWGSQAFRGRRGHCRYQGRGDGLGREEGLPGVAVG